MDRSFDGRSAATHFALMCAFMIVVVQLLVQIGLQPVDAVIELLAEIELD